jgi:hypothetical protein
MKFVEVLPWHLSSAYFYVRYGLQTNHISIGSL